MSAPVHTIILGGGIAGLSALWHLRNTPGDSLLLEASDRVGGKIGTVHQDGFILERGPDSFITQKPDGLALSRELGLEDQLIPSNPEARSVYVARGKRLHALPNGFRLLAPTRIAAFLTSPLFSLRGKLRALREPFIPPGPVGPEESITEFVTRRFGREILDRVAGPILSGIYNGDPDTLGIHGTFPILPAMEQKYGSLIRGFRARSRSAASSGQPLFMSYKEGMATLPQALCEALQDQIRLNSRVQALERISGTDSAWRVQTSSGPVNADNVVLALPPNPAAELLRPILDAHPIGLLHAIECRSSIAVSLGFPAAARLFPKTLDGYGFVTGMEERNTLTACTWSSTKFAPCRAPKDFDLVRIFAAGPAVESQLDHSDEHWAQSMQDRLSPWMQWSTTPTVSLVQRWPNSNPQYSVGHRDRMADIQKAVSNHPGLHLIGGAYGGVGIPDCIRQGREAAELIR